MATKTRNITGVAALGTGGTIITVDPNHPGADDTNLNTPFITVDAAIAAASATSEILIAPGSYTISSVVTLARAVKLIGTGAVETDTVITLSNASGGIDVNSRTLTLQNLHLKYTSTNPLLSVSTGTIIAFNTRFESTVASGSNIMASGAATITLTGCVLIAYTGEYTILGNAGGSDNITLTLKFCHNTGHISLPGAAAKTILYSRIIGKVLLLGAATYTFQYTSFEAGSDACLANSTSNVTVNAKYCSFDSSAAGTNYATKSSGTFALNIEYCGIPGSAKGTSSGITVTVTPGSGGHLRYYGSPGKGSTNTSIVRWSTADSDNAGGLDVSFVQSAANGDYFLTGPAGNYTISVTLYQVSGASTMYLGVGGSLVNISTNSETEIRAAQTHGSGAVQTMVWSGYIPAATKVWVCSTQTPSNTYPLLNQFTICRNN